MSKMSSFQHASSRSPSIKVGWSVLQCRAASSHVSDPTEYLRKACPDVQKCFEFLADCARPFAREGSVDAVTAVVAHIQSIPEESCDYYARLKYQRFLESRRSMQSTYHLMPTEFPESDSELTMRLSFPSFAFPTNLMSGLEQSEKFTIVHRFTSFLGMMSEGSLHNPRAPPPQLDGCLEHQHALHRCMVAQFSRALPWFEVSLAYRFSALVLSSKHDTLISDEEYREARALLFLSHIGTVPYMAFGDTDEIHEAQLAFSFWCAAYVCPYHESIGPVTFRNLFFTAKSLLAHGKSHVCYRSYLHFITLAPDRSSSHTISLIENVCDSSSTESNGESEVQDDAQETSSVSSHESHVAPPPLVVSKAVPKRSTICDACGKKCSNPCSQAGCTCVVHKGCADATGQCAICSIGITINEPRPKRNVVRNECVECHKSVKDMNTCSDCHVVVHEACAINDRCWRCAASAPAKRQPPLGPANDDSSDDDSDTLSIDSADLDEITGIPDGPVGIGTIGPIRRDRNDREYSFIRPDDPAAPTVMIHSAASPVPLRPGDRVTFTPVVNPRAPSLGMQATGVLPAPAGFQFGEGNSTDSATITTGAQFMNVILQEPPAELAAAIETATLKSRLRVARLVQQAIREHRQWHHLTISMASIFALHHLRRTLNWSWATMTTMMGTYCSILRRLDAYSTAYPVTVGEWGSWKDACRAVTKLKNLETVTQSTPATTEDIVIIVNQLIRDKQQSAAFLLIIAWSHAARVGNVATLLKRNFLTNFTQIRWDKAKTTATRGPYTTTSVYGPFASLVTKHLQQFKSPTDSVCSTSDVDTVRKALKAHNKTFDLRSLRRGALQSLAASGCHSDTLLIFSGHTTKKSLLRYLGWGEKYMADTEAARAVASTHLWKLNPPRVQ